MSTRFFGWSSTDRQPGTITIASGDPGLTVEALLDDTAPRYAGRFGGWETVDRPRRIGLVQWDKEDPMQVTLVVLLDKHAEGGSLRTDLDHLDRMAERGSKDKPPTVVWDTGGMVRHDLTHEPEAEWVITALDYGAALADDRGVTVRQSVTVTFTELDADSRLKPMTPAKKRAKRKPKKKGARKKTYTVKAGDTLQSIAARELGDRRRWTEIRDLNKIRDPRSIKPRQVLKLP